VTVDYATADGTASAPDDYAAATGTVTFAPGDTTQTLNVIVNGDTLGELYETFRVDLMNPTNVVITDGSGTGTIIPDEPATLAIHDLFFLENDPIDPTADTMTYLARFIVSRSHDVGAVSFDFETVAGSATAGEDYVAGNGTVAFADGEVWAFAEVLVVADRLDEADEIFSVRIANPSNATIVDDLAHATIVDDDLEPTLSIDDVSVTEGDSGTTTAAFTVSLSAPSGRTVTVDYATADGTASAPDDYAAATGTVTFAPGDTTAQVAVEVAGDVLDEIDETFALHPSDPVYASIADGSAIGTIFDDDPLPSLSIDDVAVTEGDIGTTDAVFTVLLSAPSGRSVSVAYTTADVTATAGQDYAATFGSVTIPAGDTKAAIVVKVNGDLLEEPDETFTVTLVDPGAAVLSDDHVGTGTIVNDDGAPEVSINDRTVLEGNDGTTPATFTLSLTAPSTSPVSVDWTTVDGTAVAGADYVAATGTLTFAPGDTTAPLTITVLGDLLDEFNEQFTVELTHPTNATIADGSGTGTIRDDDAPVALSIDDVTVTEGDAGTTLASFTVTLSAPSGKPISVDYTTASQTALAGKDYVPATGTLSIPAGDSTAQLTIDVTGDTAHEADEVFRVDLSNAVNAAISDGSGTGTITNDDPAPTISIADATVTEGEAGTTSAVFSVTLSGPSFADITVAWSTAAIDATADDDYATSSGIVTFLAGDVDQPIIVDVYGDTRFEPDETFSVMLSNPTGAVIADGSGTATILNDDADLSADVSVAKSADHSTTNPLSPGQRLIYTISVTNQGPGTATDVRISDVLPGTSSPNDAQWCEVSTPATTCDTTLGDPYDTSTAIPDIEKLGSGEQRTFQIGYTVAADLPSGTIQNRASVATSSTDPNPTNDASTARVLVDAPPVASFTWSPELPVVGGLVRFDGTGSTDSDGIVRYEWMFGDGATATGPTAAHSYASANAFGVSLRVVDTFGVEAESTKSVQIAPRTAPSAGRALTGTIRQLVAWGPGGEPAVKSVPLAGATVSIPSLGLTATTDASGTYSFVHLPQSCGCFLVVRSNGTIVATPPRVQLGGDPSTTLFDITAGSQADQVFLSGRVVPPDGAPTQAPTIAIRVFAPNGRSETFLADSTTLFGGSGGWGTYRLALGRWGSSNYQPGATLRVVLFENGVQVRSTTVTIPAIPDSVVQVTAADLVGQ
jgi:uncharacterized repeat protein (TIGR01451 family)